MNYDEGQGPRYGADIILPLYRAEDGDRAVFLEPRLNYANSEFLLNTGVGYRQLVKNRAWLVGGNMFWDYETEAAHYRVGWGAEAVSRFAELRANYYLGLSQKRLTEDTGGTQVFEEVVDGYDVEVGSPIPYYSRVKVFGGFNWYNYKEFKNRYGWTIRTEYTPVKYLVVDWLLSNDTKTNLDWGVTVAFRLPLGGNRAEPIRNPVRPDTTMFPESDMQGDLWRLVERHHEIVVEAERRTSGVSVEIVRND
ncbi:MAG: inverse autotransporter beta domain-containing protein [Candidatus Omnitrophica bacterium]|nr:inverse autotransporter beta domain-containing protein [Candidatus Omnitrophota bacterium]